MISPHSRNNEFCEDHSPKLSAARTIRGVMLLPEPKVENLASLFEASSTPAAWPQFQESLYQNFFRRCLSNVSDFSIKNQNFVLAICCRALICSAMPLWPAHEMLMQPETSEYAAKLVQCLTYEEQGNYLPTLVALHHKTAARVVTELSHVPSQAPRVADAVRRVEYRDSFDFLSSCTVWYLVDYLKEQNRPRQLVKLVQYFEERALRRGIFTYCIAQGLGWELKCNVRAAVRRDTSTVHHSIYFMNYWGTPLDVGKCLDEEPEAMAQLASRYPSIASAVSKERRRLLLLCRLRYQGCAQNKFWHDVAQMDPGPLSVIGKFL